jgi:alpha-galactosidase
MGRLPMFVMISPRKLCALLPVAALATVLAIPAATPAAEAAQPADFHAWWAEQAFGNGRVPFSFVYDGRRSSKLLGEWRRAVSEEPAGTASQRRTLTFTDPRTGLEVRAAATVYADTPSVEWTLYFTNRGRKDTPVLEQVQALDVTVQAEVPRDVRLHRLLGSACRVDEWLPFEDAFPPGDRINFAPVGGRPSSGACPFFNLQWANGGVITAVGWSGQWAAKVERSERGAIRLTAGMQTLHLKLSPGETIRSPRILQLYWFGKDPFLGHNLFRRVMLAHIVPRIDGRPVVPPIAHTGASLYELNDSSEANVLAWCSPSAATSRPLRPLPPNCAKLIRPWNTT